MPYDPRLDRLRTQLAELSRAPFQDLLADLLAAAPSPEDIRRLAGKSPDRWAQAVTMVARLGGYAQQTEVALDARIADMSDSELLQALQALEAPPEGSPLGDGPIAP